MARIDGPDPIPTGGDWFTQNAPPPAPAPVTGSDPAFASGLTALYQQYYHRDPTPQEIEAHRGNPNGLAGIETMLKASQANPADELPSIWPTTTVTPPPAAGPAVTPPPVTTPPPASAGGDLGMPTSGFGAAPVPYMSNPEAPQYQPLPAYRAPEWTGGDYVPPTEADLYASPGYQARLDQRLQAGARRFAAQGTILNGGTAKALDQSAQDYATNEYQTLNANRYDEYKTRYAQFADAAGRDLASRSINQADANTTFANRTAAYAAGNTRTLSDYLTNVQTQRNSQNDYWSRLQDLNNTGANLAAGSR